jgi:hypothetical protein
LVDDDIELEVLHGGVEVFLDGFLEAVDFVDEEDITFLEVGEEAGEVGGFLDGRATGCLERAAHGFGEDVGEGGFAKSWRAA